MFTTFCFIVAEKNVAAFVAEITPYDFDSAEVLFLQDQGTGVFEVTVKFMEKDRAALEKLAARFA